MADRAEGDRPALRAIRPDGSLYRIARPPAPWSWPDWAHAGSDGTFGNRWDDPHGVYRVLYASSSKLGAFVEVLARFRADPHVATELDAIEDDEDATAWRPGDLDAAWLGRRRLGVARLRGDFADVGHSTSLAHIHDALAARALHYGLDDPDAATIRLSAPRGFTQEISRHVYEQTSADGRPWFAGIAYRSRLGDEFRNWALFEPAGSQLPVEAGSETLPIERDDPDLQRALELLGVRLVESPR